MVTLWLRYFCQKQKEGEELCEDRPFSTVQSVVVLFFLKSPKSHNYQAI